MKLETRLPRVVTFHVLKRRGARSGLSERRSAPSRNERTIGRFTARGPP
jgi:hypothetical protein